MSKKNTYIFSKLPSFSKLNTKFKIWFLLARYFNDEKGYFTLSVEEEHYSFISFVVELLPIIDLSIFTFDFETYLIQPPKGEHFGKKRPGGINSTRKKQERNSVPEKK